MKILRTILSEESYLTKSTPTQKWRYDTQHNDIQHNNSQHNDALHSDNQQNDIQHNNK